MRYWAADNPHQRPLHSPCVTVWCAISSVRIIGPWFFEENEQTVTVTSDLFSALKLNVKQTRETFKAPHVLAVQHERKPITEKREYSMTPGANNHGSPAAVFTPTPGSKIFIRKDLGVEAHSPGWPSSFSLADLGIMSHTTLGKTSLTQTKTTKSIKKKNFYDDEEIKWTVEKWLREVEHEGSLEEEGSTDSFPTNGELSDAFTLARDKSLISRALDTMAKVVGDV
ncbi:hypothetical protein J437_LFUL018177, partial [Ladona fulva]